MSKPQAPTPPNPIQTAQAQTGTNVATGVTNAFLNNVNQNTPEGSLQYDVTGSHSWTDPSTGQAYSIPTFTSTQSLSPQNQAIQSQLNAAKFNMAGMANTQSGRISDLLSTPFDPVSGAPVAGDPGSIWRTDKAATTFDTGPGVKYEFADAGPLTKSYGPGDFSADRQRVEGSLMDRMDPQLSRDRERIQTQLADQGIRYGSPAYAAAMDDYNRQSNDARFAAIGQAGGEQQRMMDMAAQRAGFENAAQQQNYEQLLGRAMFYNQAVGQGFGQNLSAAQFKNAGLAQQLNQTQSAFNAQNTARNQYLQEQYGMRNQPLNEISGLMSSSQVQAPSWLSAPQNQIANTDFASIMNQNAQLQQQNYQTAQSGWNSLMGGMLGGAGLAAGGMIRSDERVKENIHRIGTVFSSGVADVDHDEPGRVLRPSDVDHDEVRKLPIYQYSYKDDPASTRHVGPMAQDVEKIDKGAVKTIGGVKHIDPKRVMGNILRAA